MDGENSLILNEEQTVVKLFLAKKQTNPICDKLLEHKIESSIKVLGATITDNFNFDKFISKKVQTCSMHLRNLYNIRNCLNFATRKMLVTNLILSQLDYCNILLINSNKRELRPLQLIMNRCNRFIYNIKFRQHPFPIL